MYISTCSTESTMLHSVPASQLPPAIGPVMSLFNLLTRQHDDGNNPRVKPVVQCQETDELAISMAKEGSRSNPLNFSLCLTSPSESLWYQPPQGAGCRQGGWTGHRETLHLRKG